MKNCGTCKHWDIDNAHERGKPAFGRCRGIAERHDIEDRDLISPEFDETADWEAREAAWDAAYNAAFQNVPAFLEDGSDYRADLYCRSTFACALWEEKPSP